MPANQILVADTRLVDPDGLQEVDNMFKESARDLSVRVKIFRVPETELNRIAEKAVSVENLIGIVLFRATESTYSSRELEPALANIDIPVVELFLGDLGHHQRIDQTEPGRRIIRTVYGRRERGIFWAMHFLVHCRDYPYQTIAYGRLDSQIGDLMLPAGRGPFPVVMLIHGGFWRDGYYRDSTHGIAADLAKRGIAAWNIEYRRVGPSGGGFPESHQDALDALNFLNTLAESYPLDLQKVGIAGHSAGGYLATWAGSIPAGLLAEIMPAPRVPVRLAMSMAGVTDLDEAYKDGGGEQAAAHFLKEAAERPALRRDLSVGYLSYAPGTQLVIVHGLEDNYIPVAMSEHTCRVRQERGVPCELILYPATGHNEFVDPTTEAWRKVAHRIEGMLTDNFSV